MLSLGANTQQVLWLQESWAAFSCKKGEKKYFTHLSAGGKCARDNSPGINQLCPAPHGNEKQHLSPQPDSHAGKPPPGSLGMKQRTPSHLHSPQEDFGCVAAVPWGHQELTLRLL